MITIIIGVILLIYVIKNYNRLSDGLVIWGAAASIVICICGILVPMAGFTDPVEETIELMPLRLEQETDKVYYVECKDGYYYYAFDNSEKYGLGGGAYQRDNVYQGDAKIYESEECTVPIFKRYTSKSKISWYSLAGMWDDTEYVFYIPVGTKFVPE